MSNNTSTWFLKKKNNTEYGPVSLQELITWAGQCRIVAGNQTSQDREVWIPVEDIPALAMDWVAKRKDGKQYGPFPLSALAELVRHNVLPDDAVLTHRESGDTMAMQDALENQTAETIEPPSSQQATTPRNPERNRKIPTGKESGQTEDTIGEEHTDEELQVPALQPDTSDAPTPHPAEANDDSEDIAAMLQEMERQRAEIERLMRDKETIETEKQEILESTQAEMSTVKEELARSNAHQGTLQQRVQELTRDLESTRTEHARSIHTDTTHETTIAELRQQAAFMKKNIAALSAQLGTLQQTALQRARMLAVALVVVTLLTAAMLVMLLSQGRRQTTAIEQAANGADTTAQQSQPAPLPPLPDRHNQLPGNQTTPSGRGETAATQLPAIQVAGISNIRQDRQSVTLRFDEGIFSSLDTLSPEGRRLLDAIVRQLPQNHTGISILIEGHTDNIPMRSTTQFADNSALAAARAAAVANHFTRRAGFPPQALTARAGAEAPFPNDTAENRGRNRTVTIRLQLR